MARSATQGGSDWQSHHYHLIDPIFLWLGWLRRMFFFLLLFFLTLILNQGCKNITTLENERAREVSGMVKAAPLGSLSTTQMAYLGFLPSSGYWGRY